MASDRYSRQEGLVLLDELERDEVSVVGVGAVGRNVAIQLAAMGVPNLHLLDFDQVEESNVASQGYSESDIGKYKVEAVASSCLAINSSINLRLENDRYRKKSSLGKIVFSCVDSMSARKLIFEGTNYKRRLLVDGRMLGEVFRVLSAWDESSNQYYSTTLFSDSEATQGRCTARSTIYCASILAGFEISCLARWLRKEDLDKDVLVNLSCNELEITA
jgi:sulfur carrier protein ThiS adenylyltransferase